MCMDTPETLPTSHQGIRRQALTRFLAAIAVGAIFFIAAYLRLAGLEHSSTGGDQAVLLNIALRWVTQGEFPLAANKSSVGLMNPPLLEYLLALPLFLKRDMLLVAQFVALLNLAGVGVTFFVLRAAFGVRLALLATLLFAVNPWSVYYSRLIWNPTMIPLFSSLLLGGLIGAFAFRHKGLHLALSFVWLSGIIQLHLASVAVAPAVLILLWVFRKQVTLKALLIGLLVFVLSFAPFIAYEISTGFQDLDDFRNATSGPVETNLAAAAISLGMAGETGITRTVGEGWSEWRAATALGDPIKYAAAWLLLAGVMASGVILARRREEFRTRRFAPSTVGLVVAVLSFAIPILFYIRHSAYLQNYYFLYLYPALFVFMALPADVAIGWASGLPNPRKRLALPLASLPAMLTIALAARQFYVDAVGLQLTTQNASGAQQILHVQQAIDAFADYNTRQPECDLILASDGHTAETSILGQVGEFLRPRPVRHVRLGSGAIVPRTCALYLVASDGAAARAWYEAHATRLPGLEIRAPEDTWHFYELTPDARAALAGRLATATSIGQWDNGVQLLRYELSPDMRPSATLALSLTWAVTGTPLQREYHFFNHLLDPGGALVAQADGPGVYTRYWQPGEFYITWFDIVVPPDARPGAYTLSSGLYDWPSLERPHLIDGRDSLPLASIDIQP